MLLMVLCLRVLWFKRWEQDPSQYWLEKSSFLSPFILTSVWGDARPQAFLEGAPHRAWRWCWVVNKLIPHHHHHQVSITKKWIVTHKPEGTQRSFWWLRARWKEGGWKTVFWEFQVTWAAHPAIPVTVTCHPRWSKMLAWDIVSDSCRKEGGGWPSFVLHGRVPCFAAGLSCL